MFQKSMLDIKLTHLTTNNRFIDISSKVFPDNVNREQTYFNYIGEDLNILKRNELSIYEFIRKQSNYEDYVLKINDVVSVTTKCNLHYVNITYK